MLSPSFEHLDMSDLTVEPPMHPHPDPSAGSEPTPGISTPSLRRRLSPYLTKIAHGSAPFISTFVLIHLTSPALATIGGSSLASQVMVSLHL